LLNDFQTESRKSMFTCFYDRAGKSRLRKTGIPVENPRRRSAPGLPGKSGSRLRLPIRIV